MSDDNKRITTFEKDDSLLDFIIFLVRIINEKTDKKTRCITSNGIEISGSSGMEYILNQLIRQIYVTDDNYYVSEAALIQWNELTSETQNIFDFYYRNTISCDRVNDENYIEFKDLKRYTGNSDESADPALRKKKKGGYSLTYNDVFHDDHIIPVSLVIEELIKLADKNELNRDRVAEILSKLCLCKMLKSEDRKIKTKYKRYFDKEKNIKEFYEADGVDIIPICKTDIQKGVK